MSEILYPEYDPITGAPAFMEIDHPKRGLVMTYGGPFDSYTLSERDEDESTADEIHFIRERFDHDEGCWVDSLEMLSVVLVSEDHLIQIEEKAIATAKAEALMEAAERAVNWAKDYGYISTFGEYQSMKAAILDGKQNEKCGKINLDQGIEDGTIIVPKFFKERQRLGKKQQADKQEPRLTLVCDQCGRIEHEPYDEGDS
ncbi:MAG: hypothetical protein AB7T74_04900, partial [Clostridia bacterium]